MNTDSNLWYDFGEAEGGDIIKLGKYLYHTNDISTILRNIAQSAPGVPVLSCRKLNASARTQIKSEMRNIQIIALSNEALLSYMLSRKIDLNVAMTYCSEIHYDHFYNHYYGIAFENISGGYEIRNPYFKGCRGKKDISFIKGDSEQQEICCVFEGFMDFLAYKTYNLCNPNYKPKDCLVLNSVSTLKKAVDVLAQYKEVHCYLDNDQAGLKATEYLTAVLPGKIQDMSINYANYKDVNDFIRNIEDFDKALNNGIYL